MLLTNSSNVIPFSLKTCFIFFLISFLPTGSLFLERSIVIPNLSSTLPIAGALAGGPGLAIVMLITHHLLQEPIDKLTQFEYQVSGPWKSPEIVSVKSNKDEVTAEMKRLPEDSTNADDSL